jgi:hypothetical protein
MGLEEYQSHCFPCQSCGEDMVIGLHVDYARKGWRTEAVENAEHAIEQPGAPIMNVDANFIVPEAERYKDLAFPRLPQMVRMVRAAEKDGSFNLHTTIANGRINERPYRRPDLAGEWKLLKKAWSLYRRDKAKLSERQITEASARYYASDPLDDLLDWMWRFTLFLGQPSYEPIFREVFDVVKAVMDREHFTEFREMYGSTLVEERAERYFELMRDYFSGFAEFGQVYFLVARGIEIEDGNMASSSGFERTRMFYGNAYEAFASSVDILAYLNNLRVGRRFDAFEKLTRKRYLELDKASRFSPFGDNTPFTKLCQERDNQLRNASHHGSVQFDCGTQLITYRSGKGGTGAVRTIGYAAYLAKCTRIFLQAMTLLRTEIMMCHLSGARPPL